MSGRSRPLPVLLAALCTAAVLATASGCAGDADADSATGSPTPAPTPTVLDSTALQLPIAGYLLTPPAQLRLDQASQLLVTQCMQRHGFTYLTTPAAPRSTPTSITEMRYGVTSPDQAKSTGYHFGPADPGYLPNVAESSPPDDGDPGYQLVLKGNGSPGKPGTATSYKSQPVSAGGCLGDMHDKLSDGATFLGDAALAQQIDSESFSDSLKAPAVRAVFQEWSACMAAKGFHYATPMDAVNDPAFAGPTPGRNEQQTAEADVACKQQENVVGVWFTAEVDRQHALMAQHSGELQTIKVQMAGQAAVVDDLLRHGD
ncbi:hypothetical protein ACIGXM_18800 [Kitasatospora sp. NPDC052896]|uniref:hypothetical protein n=1 Tax=Kitasatospora sp. NPDC052896 TaxID=3364061 RepID=UPI0037C9E461